MIAGIRGYRFAAPRVGFSRRCLHAVSCSRHVEAVARASGSLAAIRAFRVRNQTCRPGYSFEFDENSWTLVCADGTRVSAQDASANAHEEAAILALVTPRG